MASESGQQKLALAIFRGIERYRKNTVKSVDKASPTTSDIRKAERQTAQREIEAYKKAATVEKKTRTDITPTKGQIIYKIQFLTSPTKLRNKDSRLKGLSPVDFYKDGGSFKYTYGTYRTQPDAASDLKNKEALPRRVHHQDPRRQTNQIAVNINHKNKQQSSNSKLSSESATRP